jgi:DNA-binding transcriptional LysR family regulator
VLLPEPCVLRQHAIESMTRARRPGRIAFTGSSMASVQAAVGAGLGVSIVPRSLVAPGMRVLSGAPHRDPGLLQVGLLRAPNARKDIVEVLERVMRETLQVLGARRG